MNRKIVLTALLAAPIMCGIVLAARAYQKPKTVIHLVTIRWAAEAAPEVRRAALEDIEKMAAAVPGIRNVWLRTLRVQPRDFMTAFALEFEDEGAAERFARHPAHEAWIKKYLSVIEESRTQQVTN